MHKLNFKPLTSLLPKIILSILGWQLSITAVYAQDTAQVKYLDVLSHSYFNRASLVDSLLNDNPEAVFRLRSLKVMNTMRVDVMRGLTMPNHSRREGIFIHFYLGEYDSLLANIETQNYFIFNPKEHSSALGFGTFNLTYDFLEFWRKKTDQIVASIQQTSRLQEEKDFLITYWKCILLFIESDRDLHPDLIRLATEYVTRYPNSRYSLVLNQRLLQVKKTYRGGGFAIGAHLGVPIFSGKSRQLFSASTVANYSFEIEIRNWTFMYSFLGTDLKKKDSVLRFDGHIITSSDRLYMESSGFQVGRQLLEKRLFFLKGFAGYTSTKIVNEVKGPDGKKIKTSSNTYAAPVLIAEGNFNLIGLFSKHAPLNGRYTYHFLREEKSRFNGGFLFMRIRAGISPQLFYPSTGAGGSMFFVTGGLVMGGFNRHAHYKKVSRKVR